MTEEAELLNELESELSTPRVPEIHPFSNYNPVLSPAGAELEELRSNPDDICNYNASKGLGTLSLLSNFFRLVGCTDLNLGELSIALPGNVVEFKVTSDWRSLKGYLDVFSSDTTNIILYGLSHSNPVSDLELVELIENREIHGHPVRYGKVWLAQFVGEGMSSYVMRKVGMRATVVNIETLLDTLSNPMGFLGSSYSSMSN